MNVKQHGKKGFATEELLREYFLRAGFFVVRGANLLYDELELTDVDLWIYERSATLARRRTIIDVKDKQKPQAAERLFFVSGLGKTIGVEGVGVATTDKNPKLRALARKNKVLWIDGDDLQRLKKSDKLLQGDRLTDETFFALIDDLDKRRGGRAYRIQMDGIKSAVVDRFGASSANLALDAFMVFSNEAIKSHPKSDAAKILTRMSFFAAALAAGALDFASADFALRPMLERRNHMANAIRFGENVDGTYEKIMWAEMALREYVNNGASIAIQIRTGFEQDLKQVPAEDFAEIVVKLSNTNSLFDIARILEYAAYRDDDVSFDALPTDAKSFVGALLDFSKQDRKLFASASPLGTWAPSTLDASDEEDDIGDLIEVEDQGDFKL
jgi:hypothetical protein